MFCQTNLRCGEGRSLWVEVCGPKSRSRSTRIALSYVAPLKTGCLPGRPARHDKDKRSLWPNRKYSPKNRRCRKTSRLDSGQSTAAQLQMSQTDLANRLGVTSRPKLPPCGPSTPSERFLQESIRAFSSGSAFVEAGSQTAPISLLPTTLIAQEKMPVSKIEFPCSRLSNSLLTKNRESGANLLRQLHFR
jgi:hypothetical protein